MAADWFATIYQEEFIKAEGDAVLKKKEVQAKLRAELDMGVEEQAKQVAKRQQQENAEATSIHLFQEAKKVV